MMNVVDKLDPMGLSIFVEFSGVILTGITDCEQGVFIGELFC